MKVYNYNKEQIYKEFFNLKRKKLEFAKEQKKLEIKERIPVRKRLGKVWKNEERDIQAITEYFEKKHYQNVPKYNGYYMFDGVEAGALGQNSMQKSAVNKAQEAAKAIASDAAKQATKKMMQAVYRIIARAALQVISSILAAVSPYILGGLAIFALVLIVAAAVLTIADVAKVLELYNAVLSLIK